MNFIEKTRKLGLTKTLDDISGNKLSYLRYLSCRLRGKIYFGSYLAAIQGKSIRHFYMQELVRQYNGNNGHGPVTILEIGSWAGGSAITWAEAVKKYARTGGNVLCIDPWKDYIDVGKNKKWTHLTMKKAFQRDKIYKLFQHNVLASKNSDIISAIRGRAESVSGLFRENTFDLIFIDANHEYEHVRNDLSVFSKLVKPNGILCGDDLELQYDEVDPEFLKNNIHPDVIADPVSGRTYHPGVTLALHEFFAKKVSVWEGFWAMQKDGAGWTEIDLHSEAEIKIPDHLKE